MIKYIPISSMLISFSVQATDLAQAMEAHQIMFEKYLPQKPHISQGEPQVAPKPTPEKEVVKSRPILKQPVSNTASKTGVVTPVKQENYIDFLADD